jgi:hypothetical protein
VLDEEAPPAHRLGLGARQAQGMVAQAGLVAFPDGTEGILDATPAGDTEVSTRVLACRRRFVGAVAQLLKSKRREGHEPPRSWSDVMDTLYVDPSRATEAGKPGFWRERQFICFDGYQRFCLAPHKIKIRKHYHKKKYAIIRPYLLCIGAESSIIDLACNAGAMGFQAYFDGFRKIIFIDHDPECLQLVQAGLEHVGAAASTVQQGKAQDVTASADTLFAFAIIHWLYSCTEDFDSLEGIVNKLSTLCRKAMFIEWIDSQSCDHLSRNPEFHKETYNRENFIRALQEKFVYVKQIGAVRFGREIWLASHVQYKPTLSNMIRQRIDLLSSQRFLRRFNSARVKKIRLAQMLLENECRLRKGLWLLCGPQVAKHVSVGKLPESLLSTKASKQKLDRPSLKALIRKFIDVAVPPFIVNVGCTTQCKDRLMPTGEFTVFVSSKSGDAVFMNRNMQTESNSST